MLSTVAQHCQANSTRTFSFLLLYCCAISKAALLSVPASYSLSILCRLHLTLSKLPALHLKEYVIGIKRQVGGGAGAKVIKGAEKRESTITHNAIYTWER